MEAVTTHLIFSVPTVRDSIHISLGGHSLMECGIEDSDHGLFGHDILTSLDADNVGGVVERCQGDTFLDALHDLSVDDDRLGEGFTAVHHTVADCVDFVHALDDAIVVVLQHSQHFLDGSLVIGHIDICVKHVLAGGGVLQVSVDADSLTKTLCQNDLGIGVEQLILQRRAACVNNQNFHGKLHSLNNL